MAPLLLLHEVDAHAHCLPAGEIFLFSFSLSETEMMPSSLSMHPQTEPTHLCTRLVLFLSPAADWMAPGFMAKVRAEKGGLVQSCGWYRGLCHFSCSERMPFSPTWAQSLIYYFHLTVYWCWVHRLCEVIGSHRQLQRMVLGTFRSSILYQSSVTCHELSLEIGIGCPRKMCTHTLNYYKCSVY